MDYFAGLEETVARALAEDIGNGDLTAGLIDAGKTAAATVISRQAAIVCGRPWVDEVMRQVDAGIEIDWRVEDGEGVRPNDILLTLTGPARSLLTAERCALNFLQLLSGTATRTRHYADLVREMPVTLLDTRKTVPGLRLAQKYAVKVGGAENHRIGLFDAFLIKENHIEAAGSIAGAVLEARRTGPGIRVQVEVETPGQLDEALAARPDWIMLDNFTPGQMRAAVKEARGTGVRLEASGGIETPAALKAAASTGVDYISIGALTKHCEAVDLSMRLD